MGTQRANRYRGQLLKDLDKKEFLDDAAKERILNRAERDFKRGYRKGLKQMHSAVWQAIEEYCNYRSICQCTREELHEAIRIVKP